MTARRSRPGRKRKEPAKPRGQEASTRVPAAPPPTPLQRGLRRGAIIAAALFVTGALWLLIYPSGKGPGDGATVEVVVDPGETADHVAEKLAQAGLVASPRLFALYLSITGGTSALVPGPHLLSDDASPRELVARLERRPGAGHVKVTFPEGWTRFDMAKRLQEKKVCALRGFLDATTNAALLKELRIDGETAEGFLFPSTYELAPDSDPADIVRRMKSEFDKRWLTLEQRYASGMLDLTMPPLKFAVKDAVTLASMVEKEAAVDEERPIIASVFLNRLRDAEFHPKLLQCDPTAGYGCLVQPDLASCGGYAGKITPAINGDPDNKYSTYKHEGLPPGPISNPGAKSLSAVLSPAQTRYLYFVARGEGRHTFSETYSSHTAAVRDGGSKDALRH
jgi:UPF0755 protein